MGVIASEMQKMQRQNAGGRKILPLLRDAAGAGAAQGPQAGQRDRHRIQALGPQEKAVGGGKEQDHNRIL